MTRSAIPSHPGRAFTPNEKYAALVEAAGYVPVALRPEDYVHVRGPEGWITVFWKHLDRAPVPFGELAWDHARRSLGRDATEEQIADAVAALLRRANAGPDDQEKGGRVALPWARPVSTLIPADGGVPREVIAGSLGARASGR